MNYEIKQKLTECSELLVEQAIRTEEQCVLEYLNEEIERLSGVMGIPNQTDDLVNHLTLSLEDFPEIEIGDYWFCGDDFPNQKLGDFAREFWFRKERYRIAVHRVDESIYEDVA